LGAVDGALPVVPAGGVAGAVEGMVARGDAPGAFAAILSERLDEK